MKGIWVLTAIIAMACLSLVALPLNAYAQQPLDEQTADFPQEGADEELVSDPEEEEMPMPPLEGQDAPDAEYPPEDDQLADPFHQQAGSSSPAPPVKALQHCYTAVPKAVFVLQTLGITAGVTYVQAGAHVTFTNPSNSGHDVQIVPSGFFTSDSFRVTINSSVHVKASSPSTVTRGRIVVNPGKNETEHYVVICP